MAEQNVVNSLFGLTPELYQQNRLADLQAQQIKAATMAAGPGTMLNPSLAPLYAQAAQRGQFEGEGIRAVGGLLGIEDPQMQLVSRTNQLVQQIGVDTPEKLQTLAAELQKIPGGAPLAVQAIEKANQMMKTGSEAQIAQQKITQEKKLREELAKLGDNPTDEEYLSVFRKFGTPDQQARAIEASINRKAKLSGGAGGKQDVVSNNGVKAGYIDAKGNFFNNQGRKVTSKEFTDAQTSHDKATDLLYKLENISEDDINKAYGSLADYTTVTGGKLLGPTSTLEAQTKINEVGIRSVLNNLSQLKGASSDKEMTQMIKDFPGYQSDPDVMKQWVNRAIKTTNDFLSRSEKRYGFDTDYGQEKAFTLKSTKTSKAKPGSSRENPIKLPD
jgi:hypothetical protein